jgi:hypothetical protein
VPATFAPRRFDELHALQRGDVLEARGAARGKRCSSGASTRSMKTPLAVEDVDLGVGHLAVHQQRQAELLHARQRRRRISSRCR